MPLENGRADERVSRGEASERAVCVCEAVSVEMGARRPPLPTAVVCPPGRRRRQLTMKIWREFSKGMADIEISRKPPLAPGSVPAAALARL